MKLSVDYIVTSCIIPRDYNISGRINLIEIPVLLHMLQFWKVRYIYIYTYEHIYLFFLIFHVIFTFTHLVLIPYSESSVNPFSECIHSGKTSRYLLEFVGKFNQYFIFYPQLRLAPYSLGGRSQRLKQSS